MTTLDNISASRTLPYTETEAMKIQTWSILYAYNLRTVRDIFVYSARKGTIKEREIYRAMNDNLIAPPKKKNGLNLIERNKIDWDLNTFTPPIILVSFKDMMTS